MILRQFVRRIHTPAAFRTYPFLQPHLELIQLQFIPIVPSQFPSQGAEQFTTCSATGLLQPENFNCIFWYHFNVYIFAIIFYVH